MEKIQSNVDKIEKRYLKYNDKILTLQDEKK